MSFEKIVHAWKDEAYRESLSSEELAMLQENPAGELALSDVELATINGAAGFTNTNALLCVQSVLLYCFTINGNCGNAS